MTLDEALHAAADEAKLAGYYRDCLRPLLRDAEGRWPRCCGSGCEPCNADLCRTAARALALLGTPRQAPLPE
jgi:hypothetical protein